MLTKRQNEVLNFIASYQSEHGIAPTIREVAKALQLTSSATAFQHIKTLKTKGYLDNTKTGWRAHTRIIGNDLASADFKQVPIIGRLSQHERMELFESITTYLLPTALLLRPSTYYGFMIKDNSFADQLLVAGDLIVIDTELLPQMGDLILVEIRNRGTAIQEYTGKKRELTIHGKIALSIRSYAGPN